MTQLIFVYLIPGISSWVGILKQGPHERQCTKSLIGFCVARAVEPRTMRDTSVSAICKCIYMPITTSHHFRSFLKENYFMKPLWTFLSSSISNIPNGSVLFFFFFHNHILDLSFTSVTLKHNGRNQHVQSFI